MKPSIYLIIISIFSLYALTSTSSVNISHKNQTNTQGFILITTLYNELHKERTQEYIISLQKNLMHELIDEVHILYDTSKDIPEKTILLDFLKKTRAQIHYITGRASFEQCFDLANQFPDRNVIICNADIYFNQTLNYLENYDLSNKFIALTRWDVSKNETLKLVNLEISQDAWIFNTPIRKFENANFNLGILGCDGAIAYHAQKSGLHVFNPCRTIQPCHLHLSNIHNYNLHYYPYPIQEQIPVKHSSLY